MKADNKYFVAAVDLSGAIEEIEKARVYLEQDMDSLAVPFIRSSIKKLIDANDKLYTLLQHDKHNLEARLSRVLEDLPVGGTE